MPIVLLGTLLRVQALLILGYFRPYLSLNVIPVILLLMSAGWSAIVIDQLPTLPKWKLSLVLVQSLILVTVVLLMGARGLVGSLGGVQSAVSGTLVLVAVAVGINRRLHGGSTKREEEEPTPPKDSP